MLITGAAMLPTLNQRAAGQPDAAERLLVRLIPRPAPGKTVFEGDVVAFARWAARCWWASHRSWRRVGLGLSRGGRRVARGPDAHQEQEVRW